MRIKTRNCHRRYYYRIRFLENSPTNLHEVLCCCSSSWGAQSTTIVGGKYIEIDLWRAPLKQDQLNPFLRSQTNHCGYSIRWHHRSPLPTVSSLLIRIYQSRNGVDSTRIKTATNMKLSIDFLSTFVRLQSLIPPTHTHPLSFSSLTVSFKF